MGIIYEGKSRQFHLYNDKVSYIMTRLPSGQLGQLYYGRRLWHRESFDHLLEFAHRDMVPCVYEDNTIFPLEHIRQGYPVFGIGDIQYPAYGIRRENGSRTSRLVYKSHIVRGGKPELPDLPAIYMEQDEETQILELYLEDPVTGVELVLLYIVYENMPVLTRSARFICRGLEPVCLERVISLSLDLPGPRYQMVDLTGAWCRKRHVDCHGLHRGVQSMHSMRGHSSHQFNPFICLKRPDAREDSGGVTDISLIYSGNFLAQAEMNTMDTVRVVMGIRPEGFDWSLYSGEKLQTPEAVMVHSGDGLSGMNQALHQLYRTGLARRYWRDREGPIPINNWETTYMDLGEEKILSTADRARELGIELFMLDDGRFGEQDDGTTSLEDWYPSLHRLPDEITRLAGKTRDVGVKPGLWLKPEMVSRDSCLYRAHPDWMLGSMDRPVCMGRRQCMLDFSKDRVVEYIRNRMEEILGDGGVSYVEWDVNRSISDLFSTDRDARYQGTVYHKQILGVCKLYGWLIRDFPHVLSESYASDDVRFDPGILYYVPQDWVSDDTDGVECVEIQYGTSLVYPISSVGSYIFTIPSHRTQRNIPLTSRVAAASFDASGYELDPNLLTEEEQYQIKGQIWFMKEHRKLIRQGRSYRLISSFEGNEAVWIVVSEDESKAIAVYFRFLQPMNTGFRRLVLKGLNPETMYRVSGMDYTSYGDELMSAGLILSDGASGVRTNPMPRGDYLSQLFLVGVQP